MRICEAEFGSHVSNYRKVLYLCHRNADPDAIGSAFALQQAFGGHLGAVQDLSRIGMALADAIGAEIRMDPHAGDYDLTVIVDTSVRQQLGDFKLGRYGLVDHHLDDGLLQGAEFYIQKPELSTAGIAWRILKGSNAQISSKAALGLLAGMISDTGRFRRASQDCLQAAAELLDAGSLDYQEVLRALSAPLDISQRIAVLTAASRAEIERQGDWLVASTQINAFEGTAAMSLVDLGADVALAAGSHGRLCRISARASLEAARRGLNLARIMAEVGKAHGGDGGGHQGAAALEAAGDPTALLKECKKLLQREFTAACAPQPPPSSEPQCRAGARRIGR